MSYSESGVSGPEEFEVSGRDYCNPFKSIDACPSDGVEGDGVGDEVRGLVQGSSPSCDTGRSGEGAGPVPSVSATLAGRGATMASGLQGASSVPSIAESSGAV